MLSSLLSTSVGCVLELEVGFSASVTSASVFLFLLSSFPSPYVEYPSGDVCELCELCVLCEVAEL